MSEPFNVAEYEKQKLTAIKSDLDAIGPGMCLAKWKQVTMHLQNGHTHSCHHPMSHHVPLAEVEMNPTALHNTWHKKQQRKTMLEGGRPAECDYCWRVEDQGNGTFSDRALKSSESWAAPFMNDVLSKPWDHDVNPSYLEVSFGSVCNFKCSYCSPHISSKWMEEIQQHGPYQTSHRFNNLDWLRSENLLPIPVNQENPYVEAFWKWWPDLYDNLLHFRITGGEPLLNKNTYRVLDHVIKWPNPRLDFSINTNLNIPGDLFDSAIEKLKRIVGEGKVKKMKLFTSCEAHGAQAEYIRHGMNYNQWVDNIHRVLREIPSIEITIMSTYNVLSIPSYQRFLVDVLAMKQEFNRPEQHYCGVFLDTPYLRHPSHQSIFTVTEPLLPYIEKQITYMYQNPERSEWRPLVHNGFYQWEIDKLRRIYYVVEYLFKKDKPDNPGFEEETTRNRRDFVTFVDEHDRRRGTNFKQTFPELVDFYEFCRSC